MKTPLTPARLAEALRDAARVARSDRGHDLATVLDVLAQDHRRDLRDDPWALEQIRDAVVDFTDGRRDMPITSARNWCQAHGATLPELLATVADAVEPGTKPESSPRVNLEDGARMDAVGRDARGAEWRR